MSTRTPTNSNYGTFEAPLNQENGDPVSDLLYTTNFALLGMHYTDSIVWDVRKEMICCVQHKKLIVPSVDRAA